MQCGECECARGRSNGERGEGRVCNAIIDGMGGAKEEGGLLVAGSRGGR